MDLVNYWGVWGWGFEFGVQALQVGHIFREVKLCKPDKQVTLKELSVHSNNRTNNLVSKQAEIFQALVWKFSGFGANFGPSATW